MRTLIRSLLLATVVAVSAAPLLAQEADVLVEKSGPAESAADTDVSYTVTVTNLGPDDAVTVALTDSIPAGMTFVSGVQDNGPTFLCTYPNSGDTVGSINCTLDPMPAAAVANFTFVFHIPPATPPGTAFVNIANVSSATDPNEENNSSTAGTVTPFPPQGDMFVMKDGPAGAGPDTDVVYTITIGNAGPDEATNVLLSDTLPGTMTFVSLTQDNGPTMSCTNPGTGNGGTINCTAATFPASATATFTLTGHIPPGTPGGTTFENMATLESENDPNDENNAAATLLVVASADIGVNKSGPASVTAGDNISYTITVTNNGPDGGVGVTLDDPMPPNTTFVSLMQNSGPTAICNVPQFGTNGTISCTFNALGASATAQFTVVIEAGNTTSVTNTATVSSDSDDGNTNNDSSTVVTTVTPSADLAVTKTGPPTIDAGANITYTVTVTNNGPSVADNVSLTDTLPADTTFVSATQDSGPTFSCVTPPGGGTGTITCTIASLAPAATATFTFVFHVSAAAANGSDIVNTADVSTTTDDPDQNNDSSTSTADVVAVADLDVVKSGPTSADAGTDITYTVTLTNNGPSDASTVSLTDAVPANTTFVSATQNSGPSFSCATPPVGGTGTITCTLGTFTSGSTAVFTFVMHISPSATTGSSIVNTADVTTTTTDPFPNNNSSTSTAIVAAEADLAITKTGPASADQGTDITYTVTVTNNGPADSLNVSLADPVPANTTFVSVTQTTGPTFSCATPPVGGTGTITCTIATLPPGSASFDMVFHINPNAAGAVSNTATVTSPNDPTPTNASTAITALAALAAVPTLSPFALALLAFSLAGIVLFLRR